MVNAVLRRGRYRRLPHLAALTMVVSMLTGIPSAHAVGEIVSFEFASSSALESGDPGIRVRLTAPTSPTTAPVEVSIAVVGGSASSADYTLSPATVTFPAGSVTGRLEPVALSFENDNIYENNETIELTLTVTSGGSGGSQTTHITTITNDDPNPSISIEDQTIDEDTSSMVFTIRRDGLTDLEATAVVTPSSGTATIGADFTAAPQGVTISPGGDSNTTTYTVDVTGDAVYEADETFTVTLGPIGGGVVPGDISATGTINDDDTPPTLTIDDVTVNESAGIARFSVTRTGETAFVTEFDVTTSSNTAIGDADYTSIDDTYTIPAGGVTRVATVDVEIIDDGRDETNETFGIDLSDVSNATISDGSAIGTIVDNDTAAIVIEGGDSLFVLEGGAADTFTVALASDPTHAVTVDLASINGQVTVSPTQLTFTSANWDEPQTVSVTGNEDDTDEDDPHPDQITLDASSTDPKYDDYPLPALQVAVGDADALLVTIDGPNFGAPGYESVFTAMVNAGGTGSIDYQWQVFLSGDPVATGSEATFSFTPNAGGSYVVRSLVSDDKGQSPAQFIQFTVLGDIGGNTFVDEIIWLAEEGITRGCNPPDNDEYCPTKTVTRGQMAAFLVRFLGLTDIDPTISFTDTGTSIFENDILKLATAGITRGCNADGTQFCPNKGVTRGQMAAFLVRAFGLTDDGGGNLFTDDDTSIFENDIDKLATAGITRGCNPPTNDNFCPAKTVTRGQMAAFLRRAESFATN